jgi:hypothetical protein
MPSLAEDIRTVMQAAELCVEALRSQGETDAADNVEAALKRIRYQRPTGPVRHLTISPSQLSEDPYQ